mmetsp:Transcript_136/g.525  ORF Transcript_136/g.525 Transcript_136/m.525 type:complete len:218 (+) Transcript_136:152-805(+)
MPIVEDPTAVLEKQVPMYHLDDENRYLIIMGVGPEGSDGQYTGFQPFQIPIESLARRPTHPACLEPCRRKPTPQVRVRHPRREAHHPSAARLRSERHQHPRRRRLPPRRGQARAHLRPVVQERLAHAGLGLSQGLEVVLREVARGAGAAGGQGAEGCLTLAEGRWVHLWRETRVAAKMMREDPQFCCVLPRWMSSVCVVLVPDSGASLWTTLRTDRC